MSFDDIQLWDVTLTNHGFSKYSEPYTQSTVLPGETKVMQLSGTGLVNQIESNAEQINSLKKAEIIVVTKELVQTGGGGVAPFSVEDLDLEAYADKIPTLMQLTPDVDQIIDGTTSVGTVKPVEPPPLVFQYDDYVLTEAENMVMGNNATFLPDVTQNPISYCNGKIDMIVDNDYLLTFGDQQYSEISFRDAEGFVKGHFNYSKDEYGMHTLLYEVGTGGYPVEIYHDSVSIDSLHIRIKNNSIQFFKINNNILENSTWTISNENPVVSIELNIQKILNTASEMSTDQFIQIGWVDSDLVQLESHISAYFSALKGEFSLTIDHTNPGMIFVNKLDEPTQKFTIPDWENDQSQVYFYFGVMYMYGTALVQMGNSFSGTPPFIKIIDEPELSETFTFRFVARNKLEVFNKGISLGVFSTLGEMKPYFQNIDYASLGASEIPFDLSKAFISIDYHLPSTVKDGVYYHLLSNAELLDKKLFINDFIQFYDNKTGIIINRLQQQQTPVIEPSRVPLTTSSPFLYAYFDKELKKVFVGGRVYKNLGTDQLCTIQASDLGASISIADEVPVVGMVGGEYKARTLLIQYESGPKILKLMSSGYSPASLEDTQYYYLSDSVVASTT